MRLAIPSLVLAFYIVASLIAFLPCRPAVKVMAGLALLAVSQKYLWYETLGGSFLAPALPPRLVLAMEVLYAAMVLLFVLLVIKDGIALLLCLSRGLGAPWRLPFPPVAGSAGIVLAALLLAGWGAWQSMRVPEVRTIEIPLARLPRSLDGFTLVHLSDIHIGLLLKGDWLQAVVDRTNALAPDLIALTGDLVDGSPEELGGDIAPLAALRARHGVFGVTGNHEYYFQAGRWLPVFAEMGVVMLHNEHSTVRVNGAELVIAGIPDPSERHFGGPGPDIRQALAGAPVAVRVLLAHQPRGASDHAASADLQLSGHTHGGNLFVLRPLIAAFNQGLVMGLYTLNDMMLHVSPGTGIWSGFSCRLGTPAEITRVVLRSREPAGAAGTPAYSLRR